MAVGGWDYYHGLCVLPSNFDDTNFLRWINDISAVIELLPNWSVKTGPTKYINNAWFVVYSNSVTTAELAFVLVRDSNGNFLEASNNVTGTTLNSYYYEYSQWVAYCPPGATFAGTNPVTAGYVPSTGFRFARMDMAGTGEWENAGYHWLHCLVRDNDDLMFGWEYRTNENAGIERFSMMGGCAIPCHASDTGALKNEAMIVCSDGNNMTGANASSQYFAADSATRIVSGKAAHMGYPVTGADSMYSHEYPWPWLECVLYGTSPVVAGNGVKGWLNPEWYRLFQGEGPANPKQLFDSGNFIFVRNWGLVGWDPSNGDMR